MFLKRKIKRISIFFGISAAVAALLYCGRAFAETTGNPVTGLLNLVTNPIGANVTLVINTVAGYLFSLLLQGIVWLGAAVMTFLAICIDFVMTLTGQIFNLSAVRIGWETVLNFTNLGFVIGIIIIAFATIFRISGYQMKQILWKLITAAILVNFSMVICAALVSVSDTVTRSFLAKTSFNDLSTALMNATNPQQLTGMNVAEQAAGNLGAEDHRSWFEKRWDDIKGLLGKYDPIAAIQTIMKLGANLFFVIVFTSLVVICFAIVLIMFLLRMLNLVFLVIISPIVWLLWVFPGTQKYYKQWWQQFTKWLTFAPVAMFFIYLTVMTSKNIKEIQIGSGVETNAIAATLDIAGGMAFLIHVIDLLVILGMLVGGLMAAEKIGGKTGAMGLQWAKAGGKWAGKLAGRAATSPLRGEGGRKAIEGLQRAGSGFDRSKFTGKLGAWITAPVRGVGNQLSVAGATPHKQAVARLKKKYENWSIDDMVNNFPTLNSDGQAAVIDILKGKKKLGKLNGEDLMNFFADESREKAFTAIGQKSAYEDLSKAGVINKKTAPTIQRLHRRDALLEAVKKQQEIADAASEGRNFGEYNKQADILVRMQKELEGLESTYESDVTKLKDAYKEFFSTFSSEDFSKIQPSAFLKHPRGGDRLGALLDHNPAAVTKMMGRFSGEDFGKFMKVFKTSGLITDLTIKTAQETKQYKELTERLGKIPTGGNPRLIKKLKDKQAELEDAYLEAQKTIGDARLTADTDDQVVLEYMKYQKKVKEGNTKLFTAISKPLGIRVSQGEEAHDEK